MPIIQSRASALAAAAAAKGAEVRRREDVEESRALTGPLAVEEEDEAPPFDDPTPQAAAMVSKVQRELRAAKLMNAAALLVALLTVGPLAILASRLEVLSASSSSAVSVRGVVNLDLDGEAVDPGQEEGQAKGWHRTYLKSRVRRGVELDSETLKVLPTGSLVWVAETSGRRARISRPVEGWMSLRSADGVEILRPDMTYAAPANSTELDQLLRSRRMQEDNAKLQEAAAEMTKKQRQLADAIRRLRGNKVVRKIGAGTEKVATEAGRKVPVVGRAIARGAEEVLKRTVRPKKAEEFLKKTFH